MAAEVEKMEQITQPRAYQLELFEESMKRNVIVTMDTGSGKTQVAKLRIEAELERCSAEKLVWFLAPTVVLAEQQHKYLSEQLPAYQSRLICGSDNVQHWSSPAIWNIVLQDIRIVVTTTRILLDAMVHGFVRLSRIALLVFDEAHHCMRSHDTNRIMQEFYHVASPASGSQQLPYILGLSASPITNSKPGALEKLEQNLNAICKAPTRHLDELRQYVHQPQMIKLTYVDDTLCPSPMLKSLQQLVDNYPISDDPYVKHLRRDRTFPARKQLEEVLKTKSTDSQKQLKDLHRRATELHQQLGCWASTFFLGACLEKLREKVIRYSNMVCSVEVEEDIFLYNLLSTLQQSTEPQYQSQEFDISQKAMALLEYLRQEYTNSMTGMIFVKERSTAAILAHLVSNHPHTRGYFMAKSFVGTSKFPRKQTLIDLADIKSQAAALADFRSRKNNLLVCTSVTEEGVDISAMNLVIRFDEPANFRAFIQSRGRARKVESKFVLMCGTNDPEGKYEKWKALEAEMISKYTDEKRRIEKMLEDEEMNDEDYDEVLSNDTTGARLSIHDAKGHLEHFCACLPTVPYADPPRPEYILRCLMENQFMAHVVLPHSVNVEPRQISGKYPWSTQKMAIKDAAFQAYVRLYEAGLINKNLLPTALPDLVITEMDFDKEEDRMLRARPRIDPWTCSVADRKNACQQVLTVKTDIGSEEPLPQIHLLVPKTIEISTAFKLFWSAERHINVDVHREQVANAFLQNDDLERLGRLSTQRLLESVFMSKMHGSSGIPPTSSVLVLPFLEIKLLQKWLTQCTGDILEENLNKLQPEQALIRIKRWTKDARPYVFQSLALRPRESHWIKPATESHEPPIEVHFEARRVPKRLDYLHPPGSKDFDKAVEFVPAAECYFDRLPAVYVKLMLLLPSILHKIEIRMVAVALNRSLLTSVAFRNLDLVEQAICASAANERSNYQRLELIGDSILKFWTSAQLCAQFPRWHEGYLSAGKDRVVSNAHLCRAATDHGLDAYIHTEPFAGSRWKPAVFGFSEHQQAVSKSRTLSSKVLADVVEALIGASFLDAKDEQERIVKVKACLARFLVGVPWESPIKNASTLRGLVPPEDFLYTNFIPLTEVTGYSFGKIILLIEALTHPSASPVGIQGSYQRLEFLGDSILDFIVVETMASHSRGLSHFTMHLIRAAVVNAHLLAFYCLGTSLEQDLHDLTTDAIFGEVEYRTTRKKTYLWQHMKHSSRLELVETQKACAKRYDELNSSIRRALESGKNHPWHLLLSLDAPKFFSDIIESILGAIFIDSKGNMQACKEFLERLGLLGYLRRIMAESIDIMHPKERLGIVGGNSTIEYVSAREVVDGAVCHSCTVLVDDVTKATSRGEVNRAAAEAKAAEEAVALLLTEKQSGGYGQDK